MYYVILWYIIFNVTVSVAKQNHFLPSELQVRHTVFRQNFEQAILADYFFYFQTLCLEERMRISGSFPKLRTRDRLPLSHDKLNMWVSP
jgi:hypothetical protein